MRALVALYPGDMPRAAEVGIAVPVLAPELPPTVSGVLAALDGAYPGVRFRIIDEQGQLRPHIKLFVGNTMTRDLAARERVVDGRTHR